MKSMSRTRKFFAVALAAGVITTGFLAFSSPSQAAYYCHWTPAGTVCNWSP